MLVVDYAPRDRSRVLFYDEDIGLSGIRLALSFSVVALLESNVLRPPISPSSFMSEGIVEVRIRIFEGEKLSFRRFFFSRLPLERRERGRGREQRKEQDR